MPLRTLTNFTVVDDDSNGRQLGFRNTYTSRNEAFVELRFGGSAIAEMPMVDFQKLLVAGEKLAELLADNEGSENDTAS